MVPAAPGVMLGGEYCPVDTPPSTLPNPELKRLMPSCFSRLRSTLAKRTLSRICGSDDGTFTLSRFTTLPMVQQSSLLVASWSDPSLCRAEIRFHFPGKHPKPVPAVRSATRGEEQSRLSLATVALGRTVTLKNCRPPWISQMIRLVSPGALPLIMISTGLTAVASATSPMPMDTLEIGSVQSTSTVLPTST